MLDAGLRADFAAGEHVWGATFPSAAHGSHARLLVVPRFCLARKPRALSHVEAAALPYAGLTAWSALVTTGGLRPTPAAATGAKASKVLLLGGGGGVGSVALQLLAAWGCRVVATCSAGAASRVAERGADVVLDYAQPSLAKILAEFGGFDAIVDCSSSGAEPERMRTYLNFLRPWQAATFVTLTSPLLANTNSSGLLLGGARSLAELGAANVRALAERGATVRWAYFVPNAQALSTIAEYADAGKVKPVIDEVFPFVKMKEAYEKVARGENRGGKIVVDFESQ